MANNDKKFDQFFKEKLINHEEQISSLGWEKLERKLTKKENPTGFLFFKIAASLVLFLGFGYLLLTNIYKKETINEELVAEKSIPLEPETATENDLLIHENSMEANDEEILISSNTIQEAVDGNVNVVSTSTRSPKIKEKNIDEQLIAAIQESIDVSIKEVVINPLENANLETLVSNDNNQENEVKYSIKIISKGIKEEPQKPAIINELEQKIDKVGGWLGRVDQGFADLQDAKNNLFTNLTAKSDKKQK
jgi:hypothetical protein